MNEKIRNKENRNLTGTEMMRRVRSITTEEDRMVGRDCYGSVDSALDSSASNNHSAGATMYSTFYQIIDHHESLREYVENILQKHKGSAIGIEFGGLGINLFKSFTPGFFKQSIGVSLSDYRTEDGSLAGTSYKKYKDNREHNIIIGNLFKREVYNEIKMLIGDQKVDFIIERMLVGLQNVPRNFLVVMTILQKWYEMLNEEGIMLIEVPIFTNRVTDQWVKFLKSKHGKVLEVAFDPFRGALKIHKLRGAPRQLPKFNLKIAREMQELKSGDKGVITLGKKSK